MDGARTAWGRLRRGWRFVVEATLSATLAWFVAYRVFGHPQPFFAPAAALLVLGAARGQRRWRAVEVVLGVSAGVLVADVVARFLGPGTALTVCVVIALTALAAVALGATTVVLVQALVSAVYVAVVTAQTSTLVPTRFVDALVGGAVALVVAQLVGPRDPVGPAVLAATTLFEESAGVLRDVAAALRSRDEEAAVAALVRSRAGDALVERLRAAVDAARESLSFGHRGAERVARLDAVASAVPHCDYLVRNVRVLARAAVVHVRTAPQAPMALVNAVESLAASLSLAAAAYADDSLRDDARAVALESVTLASTAVPDGLVLPQVTIVGQVRAAAVDLLRTTGLQDRESLDLVDDALGGSPG